MICKQLRAGYLDNFTYLLGCEKTGKALVIDPTGDVNQIMEEANEQGLSIKYIINTHGHGDHTSGNDRLKALTNAAIIMHKLDAVSYQNVDIRLDQEKTIQVGEIQFQIIHTPGHTPGGICLYAEGQLFTGDTLFVGDSGRTDLPGGDRPTLGASIRELMQLPDDTVVWPGHDYGPTSSSTLHWEKRNNVNAREYGFYADD